MTTGLVSCDCPQARHEHGQRGMYDQDGCRCDACRKAQADRGRELRQRQARARAAAAGVTLGVFTATFPLYGGMSAARLKRIALVQLLDMTAEQGIKVTGEWTFRVDGVGRDRHLVVWALAQTVRPAAQVAEAASTWAAQQEERLPHLAAWATSRLAEGVAA